MTSLHRAELHNILVKRLSPSCKVLTSKRLVSYDQPPDDGPISLIFADGTTATCDILIGADGLKSVVRAWMMKDTLAPSTTDNPGEPRKTASCAHVVFSGVIAYRASFPSAKLVQIAPKHPVLTSHNIVSVHLLSSCCSQ